MKGFEREEDACFSVLVLWSANVCAVLTSANILLIEIHKAFNALFL